MIRTMLASFCRWRARVASKMALDARFASVTALGSYSCDLERVRRLRERAEGLEARARLWRAQALYLETFEEMERTARVDRRAERSQ